MIMSRCKHIGCHALVAKGTPFCDKHIADLSAYKERKAKQREHIKRNTEQYNRNTRYSSEERSKREKFYHSRQWRTLRQQVLDRDNYLCQYCLRFGVVRPSKTVDHIVPAQVKPELMTDIDNLATICYSCHRRKTKWEQGFYCSGYDDKIIKKDIIIKKISELPNFTK